MDSSCSANRRQAWAQCSRHWHTVEDTEAQVSASSNTPTTAAGQLCLQNEVCPDECSRIESWLQRCGSLEFRNESSQVNPGQLTRESLLRAADSFEDDLSLGAEATGPDSGLHDEEFGHCPLLLPPPKSRRKDLHKSSTPHQRSNLSVRYMGQSMASSSFSYTTNKTASSVSDVLQMHAEDAEETLYQLGFGCEEPQVTARIPARFFTFPSQLKGINFRLFLESQLHRIREEDPNLSLASRFRQVEVLTAMANAFYSLYSHVSRTPLQKLGPPEFSFSSPTVERSIGQRFFGNVRTEPRSPVERLKDTVSKMCLYTRGLDSTPPIGSARKSNSLSDVAEMITGNVRGEEHHDQNSETWNQDRNINYTVKDVAAIQHAEKIIDSERTINAHKQKIQRWSQSGHRECPGAKASIFKWDSAYLDSRDNQNIQNTDLKDFINSILLSDSSKDPAGPNSLDSIITFDDVSSYVVEPEHKPPYGCPETNCVPVGFSTSDTLQIAEACARKLKHNPSITDKRSAPVQNQEDSMVQVPVTSNVLQSESLSPNTRNTQGSPCQILVTGWEDDGPVLQRNLLEDYTHIMCACSTAHTQSSHSDQQTFLNPINTFNCQLGQANSFDLEEVQSVGEENTSVEQCSTYTLPITACAHQKYSPLRGDSFQSDSSGYVEEDMQNLLTLTARD